MKIILRRNSPDFLTELRETIAVAARLTPDDIESIHHRGVLLQSHADLQRFDEWDFVEVHLTEDVSRPRLARHLEESMPMEIFVQTPTGKTITLDVERSDSIKVVKQMIEDRIGLPSEKQRLVLYDIVNRVLEDGLTLADYKIQGEDTLHLVKRLGDGTIETTLCEAAVVRACSEHYLCHVTALQLITRRSKSPSPAATIDRASTRRTASPSGTCRLDSASLALLWWCRAMVCR